MKTLRFHTGRGGQFHNPGHVTFVKFGTIQDSENWHQYFFRDEENKWYDEGGNELDCQINEDGTGYINDDNDYDTDHWVKEDELNAKQIEAIKRAIYNGHFDEKELNEIITKYYE